MSAVRGKNTTEPLDRRRGSVSGRGGQPLIMLVAQGVVPGLMRILHKMASSLACRQDTLCKIIIIPPLGAELRSQNRKVNWVPGGKSQELGPRAGGKSQNQGYLQTMFTMKKQVERKPYSVSRDPTVYSRTYHRLEHLTPVDSFIPTLLHHLSLFLLNPYGCL